MIERLCPDAEDQERSDDQDGGIRDSMPADESLAKFERLFVRGPAGSGKTTLLQWFTVFTAAKRLEGELAKLNDCVPFLIKLRNYSDESFPAPEDFPKEASTAIAGSMPEGWVHKKLKAGDGLVMVDGLDEVSEDRRADVRKWLNDLTAAFPKSRFLLTSRPHAAEEGWLNADQFVDAELQDMAKSDIHEFIDHWHNAVAETIRNEDELTAHGKLADSLKSKLGENAAIFRLATSPLLCALLCALHRQRVQKLPSDRIELYRLCVEMFMRRDEERNIDATDYIELTNRQKESLLQNFAWWMIRNELTTATPDETEVCFQRHYDRLNHAPKNGDGKAVTKLFMHRIGIIRQLARHKIDFPHRTFQEYLAAKAAAEEDDLGILVKNAHDDKWREVVILAAGLLPAKRASKLVSQLLERGDEESEYSLYLVAVAALDLIVAGEKDSHLKMDVGKRLNKIVPPKNFTAAKQLAVAGDLVVPHLSFRNFNVTEASAVVRALILIGSDDALSELARYANDERVGVQRTCITSLKFARDPSAALKAVTTGFSNIKSLSLYKTQCDDISWLSSLTSLTFLDIDGVGASDFGSLENLKELTKLDARRTRIKDLSILANLSRL